MIKSMELIGPSCLTNAKDDEPIFVLKSTDELAPGIIREWAHRYFESKMAVQHYCGTGGMTEAQKSKYREALDLAHQMEAWREEHG